MNPNPSASPDTIAEERTLISRSSAENALAGSEGGGIADPDATVPYEFRQEIARGGMGSILEAEDRKLGRTVAVKIMLAEMGGDEDWKQRFINEAGVLAQLAHPNIVPIYDIGRDASGQIFYSMKLVRGRTLQAILNGVRDGEAETAGQYTLDRLLTIYRKVCDALAFAHSRGIIHRDLKPENVMVGEFGEVLVMDWGPAKMINAVPNGIETPAAAPRPAAASEDSQETVVVSAADGSGGRDALRRFLAQKAGKDSGMTLEGEIMGTPQYMSPEQAQGRIAEMDSRSDIFSLGGILYGILTLRPPVEGTTLDEVLQKVASGSITAPSAFGASTGKGTPGPISGIPIKNLNLGGNDHLRDLRPLAGMPIEKLTLTLTPVEDISPLKGMPLREMYFSQYINRVRDFSPLAHSPTLEKIGLPWDIADIGFLVTMPKLQQVEYHSGNDAPQWFAVRDFLAKYGPEAPEIKAARTALVAAGFKDLPIWRIAADPDHRLRIRLEELPVTDITPLQGLPIRELVLSPAKVDQLDALRGMPLEKLDIFGAPVSSLEPLRGMALKVISLWETKVRDLGPLRGMPLVVIYLGPAVNDVSVLAECRDLEEINLPPNEPQGLELLRNLPKLRYISTRWVAATNHPAQTAEEFWKEYDAEKAGKGK